MFDVKLDSKGIGAGFVHSSSILILVLGSESNVSIDLLNDLNEYPGIEPPKTPKMDEGNILNHEGLSHNFSKRKNKIQKFFFQISFCFPEYQLRWPL